MRGKVVFLIALCVFLTCCGQTGPSANQIEAALNQEFKAKKTIDTQRKVKLLTERLQLFLEKRSIFFIADVTLPDLVGFRETWTGAGTTQKTRPRNSSRVPQLLHARRFRPQEPRRPSRFDFGRPTEDGSLHSRTADRDF